LLTVSFVHSTRLAWQSPHLQNPIRRATVGSATESLMSRQLAHDLEGGIDFGFVVVDLAGPEVSRS